MISTQPKKKILYIPGFCYKKEDIPSNILNHEVHYFDDFENIDSLSLDEYDLFISHSLGCLYFGEYLESMNLFERYRSKTVLYNPIVETNPLKISIKRANNIKLFTTIKGLRLVFRFFKYFITRPRYLLMISKKVVLGNIERQIMIYDKFNYNYLSNDDEFSGKYINRFNNINKINGKHDEIYFDSEVFESILKNSIR